MNIEYAATIPLRDILHKMGLSTIVHTGVFLYPSFLHHNPNRLTLQVNAEENTWQDTCTGEEGGPLSLVAAWLKNRNDPCALVNVLHWLRFNIGYPSLMRFMELNEASVEDERYRIADRVSLQEGSLIRYAIKRGIPIAIAKDLFRQLYIENKETGSEFVALGFKNEDGGYSIYNSHTEMHLSPLAITFIRGNPKPNTVHVFKDIFDYHAAITSRSGETFTGDSIILNSWHSLDNAAAYIRGYGYQQLCTWFDKSPAADQATAAFAFVAHTEPDLMHTAINSSEFNQ